MARSRYTVDTKFTASDLMSGTLSKIEGRLHRTMGAMGRVSGTVSNTVNRATGKIKTAATAAAGIATGAGFFGFKMLETGADFERAMNVAITKFEEGSEEMGAALDKNVSSKLKGMVREIGKTTEFTVTQAARGLATLATAGLTTGESLEALPRIVDFATASTLDFDTAANILIKSMGAFNLRGKNSEEFALGMNRAMNVMTLVANQSAQTMDELFEAVKQGGPSARNIEDFAAMNGAIANTGITASVAGTSLKNIALAFAGVGNHAEKLLKRLKISKVNKETGKLRDNLDMMIELREKLKGMPEDKALPITEGIFGKIPLPAVLNLLGSAIGKAQELREKFKGAEGIVTRIAAKIRGDMRGSMDTFASAVESVVVSTFNKVRDKVQSTMDSATADIRRLEGAISDKLSAAILFVIENFDGILEAIKRIGLAIGILIALNMALGLINTTLGIVNATIALFTALAAINPIVLGFIALGGAIAWLVANSDDLLAWIDSMPDWLQGLNGFLAGILKLFQLIKDFVIKPVASFIGDKIGDFFSGGAASVFDSVAGAIIPEQLQQQFAEFSAAGAGVSTQGEKIANTVEKQVSESKGQITIRNETGFAAESTGTVPNSVKLEDVAEFE